MIFTPNPEIHSLTQSHGTCEARFEKGHEININYRYPRQRAPKRLADGEGCRSGVSSVVCFRRNGNRSLSSHSLTQGRDKTQGRMDVACERESAN